MEQLRVGRELVQGDILEEGEGFGDEEDGFGVVRGEQGEVWVGSEARAGCAADPAEVIDGLAG
jgi:hypothetical protein